MSDSPSGLGQWLDTSRHHKNSLEEDIVKADGWYSVDYYVPTNLEKILIILILVSWALKG
jgi:hypothetical protein